MAIEITSVPWGFHENKELFLFKLKNDFGAYVEITNYGGTVVSIVVPDKTQQFENVVVGFPSFDGYLADTCYIGSTIGRYANRISSAKFELDGITYNLEANDGNNSNHGGFSGFNRKIFRPQIKDNTLTMTLLSQDGDGGYPGNLELVVTYVWNSNNELLIKYEATTDKNTIANFTNHSYFNLSAFKSKIIDHRLSINATYVLSSWEDCTPTGAIIPVKENGFDDNILRDKFKVNNGHIEGLNMFYIMDKSKDGALLNEGATLTDEVSGRILQVYTTYPGIFLYTGDHLSSTNLNHGSQLCVPFDGLCLECQKYPDSINHYNFPEAVLSKGQIYNESILFKFGIV
jgi:aldose 1-epimerase